MQNLNYKTKFNKGLKFKRHKLLQNLTFKNVFKIILNIDLGMGFFTSLGMKVQSFVFLK